TGSLGVGVAVQPDGYVDVVAYIFGTSIDFYRYRSNGILDSTFESSITTTYIDQFYVGSGIALDRTGKLDVPASFLNVNSDNYNIGILQFSSVEPFSLASNFDVGNV